MIWRWRKNDNLVDYRKVQSRTYNGISYASKKEVAFAQELDFLQKAGEVLEWKPQYKVSIDINGKHICNYYVDFYVKYPDESEELVEVKGFQTDIWRLKRKLLEAVWLVDNPNFQYRVVS